MWHKLNVDCDNLLDPTYSYCFVSLLDSIDCGDIHYTFGPLLTVEYLQTAHAALLQVCIMSCIYKCSHLRVEQPAT